MESSACSTLQDKFLGAVIGQSTFTSFTLSLINFESSDEDNLQHSCLAVRGFHLVAQAETAPEDVTVVKLSMWPHRLTAKWNLEFRHGFLTDLQRNTEQVWDVIYPLCLQCCLSADFRVCFRVSSVLNRDVKQYGKKYMFDINEDTCWNSDQVKVEVFLLVTVPECCVYFPYTLNQNTKCFHTNRTQC